MLRELLVAAGFARPRLGGLARRRALGVAWSDQPLQATLQCDAAIKELQTRELLIWMPIRPLDLVTKSRYGDGVLAIKLGESVTLLRLHAVPSKEVGL